MKQTIAKGCVRDKSSRMVTQLHGASTAHLDPHRKIQRDVCEAKSSGMVAERHGASSQQVGPRCGLLEVVSQILFCRE